MVDVTRLAQVGPDDKVRGDAASSELDHNLVQPAYRGNVVMDDQMVPAEGNAGVVEEVVKIFSSFPSLLRRLAQVPTSTLFRPSQPFERRDVARGCGEHYFASQWSLLEVCKRGTAFRWLDRSAEGTWRRS